MAETIQCHSCSKKFKLPANVTPGQKFRCPGCKTVLTVPEPEPEEEPVDLGEAEAEEEDVVDVVEAPPPPRRPEPPPEEIEDEPAEKRGGGESDADAWPLVGQGANMHLIAHAAYLASLLLLLIVFFIGSSPTTIDPEMMRTPSGAKAALASAQAKGTFVDIMSMLMNLAWLGGYMTAILAVGLFVAAPWRHGSRGLAVALLALTFLSVERNATPLVFMGTSFEGPMSALTSFLLEAARLTALALFMQSVGRNVRNSSLASTSGLLSIITPAAVGGMFFLCYIIVRLATPGETMMKIIFCLLILSLAGVAGWSLALLLSMTSAVRRKGRR